MDGWISGRSIHQVRRESPTHTSHAQEGRGGARGRGASRLEYVTQSSIYRCTNGCVWHGPLRWPHAQQVLHSRKKQCEVSRPAKTRVLDIPSRPTHRNDRLAIHSLLKPPMDVQRISDPPLLSPFTMRSHDDNKTDKIPQPNNTRPLSVPSPQLTRERPSSRNACVMG